MTRLIIFWLARTGLATFVRHSQWAWAVLEILHFFGLSMLLGAIGLFDLRLLGWARDIPPRALHRLVPVGIAGFAINAASGVLFFIASPGLYVGNIAFEVKLVLLAAAAINVSAFYVMMRRRVLALDSGAATPLGARIIGGVSLALWISVLVAGRMEAFFKPIQFQ
jgi:hypothetical protein